ncbi:TetR/AcrR family transcriptional regulator [Actinomadura nitritigenes]|uniref:TetR/AcrR family transcriptional regulator n=1 Tax=Actinomadura nitritigenes TaxID=134602 RepID=UPI003D89FB51
MADIVNAAGLSNEAFYRHFPSKGALVAALLEDGTERLHGHVAARWPMSRHRRGRRAGGFRVCFPRLVQRERRVHAGRAAERGRRERGDRVRAAHAQ